MEEINIPGGFVWDYVTLGYEVTSCDQPIDTEEVINKFKERGFEYSPEFGDAIVKDMEENLNSCEVEIPENLKELYTKAVEIAKNWVEEKQKSEGTGYSYDQPIQKPENLWKTLTKEDIEEFGENPDFEFYYHENNIYIIVDHTYDCMISNFGEEFQKANLEEIIEEYEN